MKQLFFSVCVPVYNVEQYLQECIESILNQTYENFELILVDDGSVDGSFQICKDYQSRNLCVKAFTKTNGGQLSAREFAFKHALGDVILCVDSDDYLEKNALELLNDYFVSEAPDCIYFNWQRVCNGKILNTASKIAVCQKLVNQKDILKKVCSDAYYNSMCLKAFKRDLLPKQCLEDFYKIRHGEDLVQSLEVLASAESVLFVPDVLYNYRINTSSISYKRRIDPEYYKNTVRSYVYFYIKKKGVFSNKDWDDYGTYCVNLFFDSICKISVADVSLRLKKESFRNIRNSLYVKEFLYGRRTTSVAKNVVICFFEKRFDLFIIYILIFKRKLVALYNFLKKSSCTALLNLNFF